MFTEERRALVPSVRHADEDWNERSDERTHL